MAKTPKVKKREVSIHSRAARRGEEPPSKDLAVKPSVEETEYKPWLHSAQNAGISKKKKTKQLTRQQKLRQNRSLENAERNIDRMEKKVADSKYRGKKVNARRADWDELNEKITGKENNTETKQTEANDVAKEHVPKKMEGVEQPDLEQPLPIRVVETADEAKEVTQPVEAPKEAASTEDLDEVT